MSTSVPPSSPPVAPTPVPAPPAAPAAPTAAPTAPTAPATPAAPAGEVAQTPPSAPSDAPKPAGRPEAKKAPKPQKAEKPQKPVKPIDLKDEYAKADKDKNGLNKSELKMLDKATSHKDYDRDEDGKVSLGEYRATQRKQNSFKGLDADKDGELSTQEMSQLRRVTHEADNAFDANDDGKVSKSEFNTARKIDKKANWEARREEAYKDLSKDELKKLADDKRYDGDKDGKVSLEEYHAGRQAEWRDDRDKKAHHLFEEAGGKDGVLKVKDAKAYRAYDANDDGTITKDEFKDGFKADRKAYWNGTIDQGELSEGLKKRLGLDEFGFGLNHIEKLEPKKEHKDAHGHEEIVNTPQGKMVRFGEHMISEEIADNFKKMREAAEKDGIDLQINSGYRSYEEQVALYNKYGPGRAAAPGTSNHEHGDAIDFLNTPGAYDWLANNASKFGLHNLPGEPWHYSPTGN